MSSRLVFLLLFVGMGCQTIAFQRRLNILNARSYGVSSELQFSPPKDVSNTVTESMIEKLQGPDIALNVLLDNMPIAEKYSLLLQSYASNIIDNSNRTIAALDTMDSLFTEMLSKSIAPSEKSSKLLIDASSTFCSSIKLGKSLQLAKAGGNCKAFGAANGQLSTPITVASSSSLSEDSAVPYDDREQEILYAGLIGGITATWLSFQVGQTFISDLHPWTTLLGVGAIALFGLDVAMRQGKGVKLASAGFERLVLKDAERETHSDGAAFLVGYLLGLPCFCFRPDVTEALKMLRDDPQGLDYYRQPKSLGLSAAGKGGAGSKAVVPGIESMGGAFQGLFGNAVPSKKGKEPTADVGQGGALQYTLPTIPSKRGGGSEAGSEELLGLSRVLVWLMAPVAAEYLKYGRTVVSDPRRSQKLLSVLEKIQLVESRGGGGGGGKKDILGVASSLSASDVSYNIPNEEEDKKMLLQWAFYEASSLIRQYGDLLEDVNSYLATGTSTVGECVVLVEEELR